MLARWGIEPPDGVVVDPASAPLAGGVPGLCPLVFAYATSHPVARGLDASRMTFFRGARSFALRKPEVEDRLGGGGVREPALVARARTGAFRAQTPPERPPDETGAPPAGGRRQLPARRRARRASSRSATPASPRTTTCARSTTSTSC